MSKSQARSCVAAVARWPSPTPLARPGRRQLGRPRPRLRPRGRDERLRRLRLRQAGKSYRFILGHYYTGTTIGTIEKAAGRPRPARHLPRRRRIQRRDQRLRRRCSTRPAATRPTASATRSCCAAPAANGSPAAARKLRAAGRGKIAIAGHGTFRGALETVPTESDAGSLNVVNALALEQYVKGVMPNEVPPSWPTEELKAQAVAVALDRPHRRRRRQRLRPLLRHPQPGLRGAGKRVRQHQRRGRRDPRPGRDVRRRDRPDALLGLLGRPHRERRQRLRLARPLPGRRPRSLRLLLPAAQMDARLQRPGNQLPPRRLPAGEAETGGDHQDRRLAADHQREARSAPAAPRRSAARSSRSRSAATTPG